MTSASRLMCAGGSAGTRAGDGQSGVAVAKLQRGAREADAGGSWEVRLSSGGGPRSGVKGGARVAPADRQPCSLTISLLCPGGGGQAHHGANGRRPGSGGVVGYGWEGERGR